MTLGQWYQFILVFWFLVLLKEKQINWWHCLMWKSVSSTQLCMWLICSLQCRRRCSVRCSVLPVVQFSDCWKFTPCHRPCNKIYISEKLSSSLFLYFSFTVSTSWVISFHDGNKAIANLSHYFAHLHFSGNNEPVSLTSTCGWCQVHVIFKGIKCRSSSTCCLNQNLLLIIDVEKTCLGISTAKCKRRLSSVAALHYVSFQERKNPAAFWLYLISFNWALEFQWPQTVICSHRRQNQQMKRKILNNQDHTSFFFLLGLDRVSSATFILDTKNPFIFPL